MSESSSGVPRTPATGASPVEPSRPLRQLPGRVEVRLPSPEKLFDHRADPTYPHTGPPVERSIARFLVEATREQRGHREIELVIVSDGPPIEASAEEDARSLLHRYFADEAELASLDQRVNRSEGLGSLRYSIPLTLAALLVAGLFYTQLGSASGVGFLEALTYLVFITIVWVLLWDPLEMLLFDSYLLRLRFRALHKLARARVTFTYGTMGTPIRTVDARTG